MSRIEYRPPVNLPAGTILSQSGSITAAQLKTLASVPIIVFPANAFNGAYFAPLTITVYLPFTGAGFLYPMELKFITLNNPLASFNPTTLPGGVCTGALMPYLIAGETDFNYNQDRHNTGFNPAVVFTSALDSPLATFTECTYEILYLIRPVI
jgi:hypothetical protein